MKNYKYEIIANKHVPEEHKFMNTVISFIVGGLIGLLGEIIIELICHYTKISRIDASTYMIIILIFIASLSTALGFFDKLVTKFKCGILIPITGFAHSMTSSALEYKNEGFIYGIGSNIFKLTGSVILYGIVSAYFFSIIRYLLGGI